MSLFPTPSHPSPTLTTDQAPAYSQTLNSASKGGGQGKGWDQLSVFQKILKAEALSVLVPSCLLFLSCTWCLRPNHNRSPPLNQGEPADHWTILPTRCLHGQGSTTSKQQACGGKQWAQEGL
ncbi:hypothetical protein KIL84_014900 [Mauremys mutica]|uniref:Uncharacterized protein n=1 Tax=Mauremys mutica TaxID=74926 RepID=A0A9D3XMK9_9SAUR|nr:hypothetical protein KIL84_014900 [Mauremys mutica]